MRRVMMWIVQEAGLRFMARRKLACAMAIVTLALALGANTVAFSVLKAFLLSSFGIPDPDRVAIVAPLRDLPGRGEVVFNEAYPNYLLIRSTERSFEDVASTLAGVSSWGEGDDQRAVRSSRVTASFFPTVGVEPRHGRAFTASEEGPSPARVVIVSWSLWQTALGADPRVIGEVATVDGEPYTIIGVMPPGFEHPLTTDVWMPFDIPESARTTITGARNLVLYARLRPGLTLRDAEREMPALARRAIEADAQNQDFRYVLRSMIQFVLPGADRAVIFVQIAALVLSMLAVVNLSSLLIAWGHDRRREMAVRIALGARGLVVVRMLVLQGLAVVGAGALGGAALAYFALPMIRGLDVAPTLALYLSRLELDATVLLWTGAVAAAAGVSAGLLPATLTRREAVGDALRAAGRGGSHTPAALLWQKGVVFTQAVLSVLILSTAALIGISFRNLIAVPEGFAPEGGLVARVHLTGAVYREPEARTAFAERLTEALQRESTLERWGFTSVLPVGDVRRVSSIFVELPDGSLDSEPLLPHIRHVSDGYLGAMELPLLQGRPFDARDGASAPLVAIVSRSLARRLWPDEDPVGKTLHRNRGGQPIPVEVVAVAGDAMDGGYNASPGEAVYVPWAQSSVAAMTIVVRPRSSPEEALAAVRRAVQAADPALAPSDVADLPSLVQSANALTRIQAILLGAFSLVAMGIVALGSYGVMSQLVTSREREFALRVAVGASAGSIGTRVLGQIARISGTGILLGVLTSWLLGGVVASFLFGVEPRSLEVAVLVAGFTLLLAALASVPAALRAMRVRVGPTLTHG